MRFSFVEKLVEIAKQDKNVFVLLADLGYGMFDTFFRQLPKQILNVGIAEQGMTAMAAGMAKEGKTVFTYSTCNFPTMRCLEQIRNDCAYQNLNVKVVSANTGMSFKAHGISHYATEDIAIMRALPNVVVTAPADPIEAIMLTTAIYKHQGTCYLRLGKGAEPNLHEHQIVNYELGKAICINKGERVAIFTTGTIVQDVLSAINMLKSEGITPTLYTFPTIKPIDKETIYDCIKKYDLIVTVEEHNIIGGFGSAVSEVIAESPQHKAQLLRLGLADVYPSIVGTQSHLKEYYGLSAGKIKESIITTLNKNGEI